MGDSRDIDVKRNRKAMQCCCTEGAFRILVLEPFGHREECVSLPNAGFFASKRMQRILNKRAVWAQGSNSRVASVQDLAGGKNAIRSFGDEFVLTWRKALESRFPCRPIDRAFLWTGPLKTSPAVFPNTRMSPQFMQCLGVLAADGTACGDDMHLAFWKRNEGCRAVDALVLKSLRSQLVSQAIQLCSKWEFIKGFVAILVTFDVDREMLACPLFANGSKLQQNIRVTSCDLIATEFVTACHLMFA